MVVFDSQHEEGTLNMAIDEAMLWWVSSFSVEDCDGSSSGSDSPEVSSGSASGSNVEARLFDHCCHQTLLRFYQWKPPAVSLGRYQRSERYLDLEAARAAGLDIVRRPTGGKALIHDNELTYSIIVPAVLPLAQKSIIQSHSLIAQAIADGIKAVGIDATLGTVAGSGNAEAGKPCFTEHLAESVLVNGVKVAGSAQLRSGGAFLQHGSIIVSMDYDLHSTVFGDRATGLNKTAGGLVDVSNVAVSVNDLKRTIAGALSAVLCEDIHDRFEDFPHQVMSHARMLQVEKYSSLDWPLNTQWRNCNG